MAEKGVRRFATSSVVKGMPLYKTIKAGLVPTTSTPTIEVLVVAGGGGGGYYNGSGGGAGGLLYASSLAVTAGVSTTVTIGAGGAGPPDTSGSSGSNGSNSVFRSGTATGGGGGGGGGALNAAGATGGSGGGGQNGNGGASNQANPSDSMTGYGFAGGGGSNNGAGGGGAGGLGNGGATRTGGLGRAYTFDVAATYAGGGIGTSGTHTPGSSGGSGHFGGGGEGDGGYGGPGICIIKYPDTYKLATTTGGPSCIVTGGYITYYFVASGTITFQEKKMAIFAELDETNKVVQVIMVDDSVVVNSKQGGIDFLVEHYGHNRWKQTWDNGAGPTKNYAGIGYIYDSTRDAFISDKFFNSFVLNEDTCKWEAPVPKPTDEGKLFYWDESTLSWVEETRMSPIYVIEDGETVWQ